MVLDKSEGIKYICGQTSKEYDQLIAILAVRSVLFTDTLLSFAGKNVHPAGEQSQMRVCPPSVRIILRSGVKPVDDRNR
jgi:hypothetical protein